MQLFDSTALPSFATIHPAEMGPLVEAQLTFNRQKLAQLLAEPMTSVDVFLGALEEMEDALNQLWSPIQHLHSVMQSEDWRTTYNTLLPLITEYHTERSQNEMLFKAVLAIADRNDFTTCSQTQKKIIEYAIRDFKLAGIHLSPDKKMRMGALRQQLNQWTTKFSENLLDATEAFVLPVTAETMLCGLPAQTIQLAKAHAESRGLSGWALTLDYPVYSTAMKFLEDRSLRFALYVAYVTRASDQSASHRELDNSEVMAHILKVRHEIATLVGFKNYAEYSLATKMAKTPQEVLGFLRDLLVRSHALAEKEYLALQREAACDGIMQIEPWDVPYYSEKLQAKTFHITQEALRPYFPIHHVLQGLFMVANQLYGVTIAHEPNVPTWHEDVRFYVIYDETAHLRGGFYIDLYARTQKREGAWMDECRARKHILHPLQHPVAYLTCNFMPPVGKTPALLTHDDVLTLFHEFGHCLHHLLTVIDYPSVAGINGVLWDAVEFPSQFMENYVWEEDSLKQFAAHYQTDVPLPHDLYSNLIATKNFQTGLQMVRQLELALFDFRLHFEYDSTKQDFIQNILNDVRSQTAVMPVPAFNRFQHSFAHIFAGGYAAGYYSYKWAEVLSADAYGLFKEKGLFDHATGQSLMKNVLEVGGTRDPMEAFVAFRGRKPTVDALLEQSGMIEGVTQ
ncbi:MAG: oligopeptidase A [Gammaproteobacteria bacterium RIFCSPHIGHO2_12_FULL_42_10]|nr:MAG: oligopeptidase A [Gammaproteobacteria bacterium RIFCSPHIGHO2_12_FULL_42_10]